MPDGASGKDLYAGHPGWVLCPALAVKQRVPILIDQFLGKPLLLPLTVVDMIGDQKNEQSKKYSPFKEHFGRQPRGSFGPFKEFTR